MMTSRLYQLFKHYSKKVIVSMYSQKLKFSKKNINAELYKLDRVDFSVVFYTKNDPE